MKSKKTTKKGLKNTKLEALKGDNKAFYIEKAKEAGNTILANIKGLRDGSVMPKAFKNRKEADKYKAEIKGSSYFEYLNDENI